MILTDEYYDKLLDNVHPHMAEVRRAAFCSCLSVLSYLHVSRRSRAAVTEALSVH